MGLLAGKLLAATVLNNDRGFNGNRGRGLFGGGGGLFGGRGRGRGRGRRRNNRSECLIVDKKNNIRAIRGSFLLIRISFPFAGRNNFLF